MRVSQLSRGLGVIVAVLAVAWFVIGARQAHEISQATAVVSNGAPLSATQERHGVGLLDSARLLNPDTQVDVLRSELAYETGHRARAARIISGVTRREPQNVQAWVLEARFAPPGPAIDVALRHVAQLAPPVRGGH